MKTTNIYTLTDPETHEIRYVGKTNNLTQRYKAHLNKARKHQTHKKNWINSLKKKKLKPLIEVIDIVPIVEWVFWETYWISQIKSWGFKLVNHTDGGDGCTFGNKTSFKKGEGSISVLKINLNGDIVKEYNSTNEVYNKTKLQVHRALDIERKSVGGFLWLRKSTYDNFSNKEFNNFLNAYKNRKRKPNSGNFKKGLTPWSKGKIWSRTSGKIARRVKQLNTKEELIRIFNSCREAAKEMNCGEDNIRLACIGKNKTAKGFIWKYE